MNTLLSTPFVGSYELREKLPLLLRGLEGKHPELVITQKGKPAGMLLSLKSYLQMKETIEELEEALKEVNDVSYLNELKNEKAEIIHGKGKKAGKVFSELGI